MIRVVIDFGNAGPRTGTGVYSRGLLAGLQEHCGKDVEAREAGISSVSTSLRPVRRLLYLSRLGRLRRRGFGGADVVHFTNVYTPPRQRGIAYVATVHDLDAIMHPEVYTERYAVYYGRTVKATLERADVVFAVTNAVRGMILERYAVPADRVKVVGNGLPPGFPGSVREHPELEGSHGARLLFVGRLELKKNIAWLVDTLGRGMASGALPRLSLQLAGGRGHGFRSIESAIRRNGHWVEWMESPSMETLAGLYARADAAILPSRCEGFGIPLLEAMQCSLPIIASRIPTSVEVTGGAAHFFELDDREQLYEAVRNALARKSLDRHRATYAERLALYSWDTLARQAVEGYRAAVARA